MFEIAKFVANSLDIPFISIKPESSSVSTTLMSDSKYEVSRNIKYIKSNRIIYTPTESF